MQTEFINEYEAAHAREVTPERILCSDERGNFLWASKT